MQSTLDQAPDNPIADLHSRFALDRDPAVMAELVEEYRSLAYSVARRMLRSGEWLEDLQQVAIEGLIGALRRYDPSRGTPFVAFALPTMIGTIKKHYRDRGYAIRTPRSAHELLPQARDAAERLTSKLGRSPRAEEVAEELGVDVETLLAAQEAGTARRMVPIDGAVDGVPISDRVGTLDPYLIEAENRVTLVQALRDLSEHDRRLVVAYFYEGLSQAAIAERLGISQMHVSRQLNLVIRRLRQRVAA